MHINSLFPNPFPEPWASSWGEDQYGLWMSLDYKGIIQCFRWCEPGEFMMGSPEDESERYDDETSHLVRHSSGFWLADTTVTQELWEAVMGKNPSRFSGPTRPVERVSWEDVQNFIRQLNKEIPGLSVRLPWEAEWEYACRAGTTTPFSFGENITPAQVNYKGNSPYADGAKGEYRKETVSVKTLPCNPWGLYEMHGNVWEWCGDWYQSDLGQSLAVDPHGPEMGDYHVVRGGSWNGNGGGVRSAIRNGDRASFRDYGIGFRLARGH